MAVLALPVKAPVKPVDVTLVKPANVVDVAPNAVDVEPIVTVLLDSLLLAIDPANIVLVTVPVSPIVTTALPPNARPVPLAERVAVPNLIVLPLRYKSRNLCVESPKSYVTSVLGIKLPPIVAPLIVGLVKVLFVNVCEPVNVVTVESIATAVPDTVTPVPAVTTVIGALPSKLTP